ncbi:MAG: DUF1549 domain-containing protein, partial [Planctomycetaceae bacterium]
WLTNGAARDQSRQLTEFIVTPPQSLARVGDVIRVQATASFTDGSTEDVTSWTQFTPADEQSLLLMESNANVVNAHVKRSGQLLVMARFLDRVLPIEFIVPLVDEPVDLTREPRMNFIDDEILARLGELHLVPAPRTQPGLLIRRLSLDLVGRLPTLDELHAFEADPSEDAYRAIVDRLLDSDEFADYWTLKFSRWLQIHSLPNEHQAFIAYTQWLHQSLRSDLGFDELTRQLLVATGDSHAVGPANFSRMVASARDQAELTSRFFLGVRMECANCHNHPLDRWTQDDFHGLAAIFAKVDRGRVVQLKSRGAVTHPRTGEAAIPKLPGNRFMQSPTDERAELATWLTGRDNRYLARAVVNRLWQAMFGRGLVDPVDDLRETNPATHPALLDRLAADFMDHGYSLRHVLRQIAISEAYRRSPVQRGGPGVHDDRFYSVATYRPLEAEVLADAIADVTGVDASYTSDPTAPKVRGKTRAITLYDSALRAPALEILGRCSRPGGCIDSATGGGLAARLHRINGDLINQKLIAPTSVVHRSIESGEANREILIELVRRALCQTPTDAQLESWTAQAPPAGDPDHLRWFEDFTWSLLNSRDFTHNH